MLKGSYVALVTPFKNNEIDYNSLEKLIDFQIDNKTDGILFCGTTGESPTLAGDEKERLVRFGIKKINKREEVKFEIVELKIEDESIVFEEMVDYSKIKVNEILNIIEQLKKLALKLRISVAILKNKNIHKNI